MAGEGYQVLFDISREPFNEWIWSIPALVMVLLGAVLIRFGASIETRLCGWLFSVVFAACGLVALLILWHDYDRLRRAYFADDYEIAEGRVEGFRPNGGSWRWYPDGRLEPKAVGPIAPGMPGPYQVASCPT